MFDVIYHLCVFDLGSDLLIWGSSNTVNAPPPQKKKKIIES